MNSKHVLAIFLRQFFLMRQKPIRVASLLYVSSFELFLWVFLTKYLHTVGGEKLTALNAVLGVAVFWSFFSRIQQSVCSSFLEDIRSKNLINLFVSPLKMREYLAGILIVNIFSAGLALLGTSLIGWILGFINVFAFGQLLVPSVFILYVFGWTLGILTMAIILRFGQAYEALFWSVPTFMVPLSGVFYTIDTLPRFLQPIAHWIPISAVFQAIRDTVLHGTINGHSLVFATLLALVYFFLSLAFFSKMVQSVLKLGLFTRLMTD